jgi:hypothetical protein
MINNTRAEALAGRLELGAEALTALASELTDSEWHAPVPGDGRKIGVVVHHVASVYPLEIQLALTLARGQAITGVTMADVHEMNSAHAREHDGAELAATLALLQHNSAAAAAAIRALTDDDLDRAAPASLYAGAPVTCQFMLEDHAVRHSYHHVARIKAALQR